MILWVALISLCSAGPGLYHPEVRVFGPLPASRIVLDKVWHSIVLICSASMAKCWQSHFSSSPKGLNYWPSTEPLSCLALFFYLIKSTLSCYSISLVLWLFPLAWSCSLPRYLFIPHQVMLIAFEASCDALSNWILFHFTDVGRLYCLLLLLLLVLLSAPVKLNFLSYRFIL